MQHRTFVAVFAPILLPTLSIMSVFQDVHAVTAAASVGDDFLYHHPIITYHLLFRHHQKFFLKADIFPSGRTAERQVISNGSILLYGSKFHVLEEKRFHFLKI
jgi:hypothetical protein